MCCEHKDHHHRDGCQCGGHDCTCGCHEETRFDPSFWTQKEKIAHLEKHTEKLREEQKAIEERIAALKAE